MPQSMTISALAFLAIGGAAGGVYLGKAAVAEIDPVHYAGTWKEARFHSDLVPGAADRDRYDVRQASFAGLGDGCVNCRTYPEEYVPQHDGSVDADQTAYPPYEAMPAAQIMAEVDRQIAQIGRHSAVARYAAYPIEQRDMPADVTTERPVEVADVVPAVRASEPAAATAPVVPSATEAVETPGI